MDLVAGVKKVLVIMEHNSKDGAAKLVRECSLPLTGKNVVHQVITELGEFTIDTNGLTLVALAPDVSLEEITAKTEADFTVKLQ
jgi:3-oxoacid CoA-transferase subunit B